MTILQFQSISAIARDILFQNLDLTLNKGDCLGLVAGNGQGKTTLLRQIVGQLDPHQGQIITSRGTKIGYMPQELAADDLPLTVRDYVLSALPADQRDFEAWRVDVALNDLAVPYDYFDYQLAELSGGWRRLVMMARLLVGEPDILVLDEPTNHLDLEKIYLIERVLKAMQGKVVTVLTSHDRAFLDSVTNKTLFLRPGTCLSFDVSYSHARIALEELDQAARNKAERDMKEINRLRTNAAKLYNVGLNSGSDLLQTKAKQLKVRAAKIEDQIGALHKDRQGDVTLANRGSHAKVAMSFDHYQVATPDGRKLFSIEKLFHYQGDRIVVLAENGRGKTQLIKAVRRALSGQEVAGIWTTPSNVVAYADQNLDMLPDKQSPLSFVTEHFDVGDQRAKGLLANIGYIYEQQSQPIAQLSFGQRTRLVLLALRLTEPNFYLLDEPTNHLDIDGREQLERELVEREPSALVISHDRHFVRAVGTRFFEIDQRDRLIEVDCPEPFFDRLQAKEVAAVNG